MGGKSRRKGKAGEREAAAALSAVLGLPCRRGVQYAGGADSPDVVGLPGVHIEVKRCERLNLGAALAQAETDAGGRVPIVLHRSNRCPWLVTVALRHLTALVKALSPHQTSSPVMGPLAACFNKPHDPQKAQGESHL